MNTIEKIQQQNEEAAQRAELSRKARAEGNQRADDLNHTKPKWK